MFITVCFILKDETLQFWRFFLLKIIEETEIHIVGAFSQWEKVFFFFLQEIALYDFF